MNASLLEGLALISAKPENGVEKAGWSKFCRVRTDRGGRYEFICTAGNSVLLPNPWQYLVQTRQEFIQTDIYRSAVVVGWAFGR